ncbi:hypothetical protein [Bradyrhizobium tunisiense]|uniref:hypothetical protein n=1 Tax=Bradyrhizobium tunisiense TaxID=3278709 RepID=UPI0035DEAD8B
MNLRAIALIDIDILLFYWISELKLLQLVLLLKTIKQNIIAVDSERRTEVSGQKNWSATRLILMFNRGVQRE